MVAARIANLGRGRPDENAAACGVSRMQAARLVNVDDAGVERARTVINKGDPALVQAPEISYRWFEHHWPSTLKIELNARRTREGWAVWGDEVVTANATVVDALSDTDGGAADIGVTAGSGAGRAGGDTI